MDQRKDSKTSCLYLVDEIVNNRLISQFDGQTRKNGETGKMDEMSKRNKIGEKGGTDKDKTDMECQFSLDAKK